MRIVTGFPRQIICHDDVLIPMADGVRLAARIWRPDDSDQAPVPAILEFLPYRRRDGTAWRDALTHSYFAGHGYAAVRVDMRGSGDSEGVLAGEYLKQEQDDGIAILEWLERQPWCTGAAGMIGISWGGFNGLQIAARRPPQLKAVISICSTDDRYADDIHFMGGALLLDKITWGSTMFALNAAPPDPQSAGPQWRSLWQERLDRSGLWIEDWLRHQRRDAFYKHGSVCENWSAITCPVLAVGGWADGYSNAVFRLLANLKSPVRGLVGPWAHKYPHVAKPGPQIGFLQECLRWWDKWLKGLETGVLDDPLLRVWMEDPIKPHPYNAEKPGRWVGETAWPPRDADRRHWNLSAGRLGKSGTEDLSICSPQTTGLAAAKWCPYGSWADQSLDQRLDMGGQLIFDTDPLEEDLDVLGQPRLDVTIAADKPQALLAATLCEVFPDGAATRISYGILNLTHRESHEHPEPLRPGHPSRIRLDLRDIGHRFGSGNRIRLCLSNAYWPIVWPSPEKTTLTISCRDSALSLPIRRRKASEQGAAPIAEPQSASPLLQTEREPERHSWTIMTDAMTGETITTRLNDDGLHLIDDTGMTHGLRVEHKHTIHPEDPQCAKVETSYARRYRRDGWEVDITTSVRMTSTSTHFLLSTTLDARENGQTIKTQSWSTEIPRDLV